MKELGFDVKPGDLGENITTYDINLLALPLGTLLHLGDLRWSNLQACERRVATSTGFGRG